MHFDDRLATVLRLPTTGEALARIQYRQLVDILSRLPANARSWAVAAGFAQLRELDKVIPAADRARLVGQPLQPLSNPRLIARLAEAEPQVATAAVRAAKLPEDAWLTLIPALPVRARGILRHRRDLGSAVDALLEQLGVQDRALPPAEALDLGDLLEADLPPPAMEGAQAPQSTPASPNAFAAKPQIVPHAPVRVATQTPPPASPVRPVPTARSTPFAEFGQAAASLGVAPPPTNTEAGIGAIVRRIEEFRKAREALGNGHDGAFDAPRLPLGDAPPAEPRAPAAIDFSTDAEGRISWADGVHAPSLIGLDLSAPFAAGATPSAAIEAPPGIASAMRHRLPLRAVSIEIHGAPAVQGSWQVDAVPRFDPASGRFIGYVGRLRRPAVLAAVGAAVQGEGEADRLRQVLHELRTPANAIQVAAEIIQQQLYGPAPHEYRALAAAIAGDCAHILAGFEELDRLVRLETGALGLETGECDLSAVLVESVNRLKAWTQPRRSGFALPDDAGRLAMPVPLDRAEAERLIWRLFAALAGSTAFDETLDVNWASDGEAFVLSIALPASLANRTDENFHEATTGDKSLSTGMFGVGFTLRLAAAETAATGGSLKRTGDHIELRVPGLTAARTDHSHSSQSRAL